MTSRIQERDEQGRVKKGKLTTEEAREMVKSRMTHTGDTKRTRIEQLLRDRGINPSDADEGLRSLAEVGVSGRSGSVSALRYLDALTGHYTPDNGGGIAPPLPGEACPTCGLWNITLTKELNAMWPKLMQFLDKWHDGIDAEIVDKDAANTEKTVKNTDV